MIAEAGLAALWMAAAMTLLQAGLAALGLWGKREEFGGSVRPVAVVHGLSAVAAMGCLIAVFAQTDMSVALVAASSRVEMPFWFQVAAAWLNREGAILLFVAALGLAGAVTVAAARDWDRRVTAAALGLQAVVALGCYCAVITGNPFARLFPVPENGVGLAPLLREPGPALHMPLLCLGGAALAVALSLALAARSARANGVRAWGLVAWIVLTLDLALGSRLSLPVDPLALVAWLGATALVHFTHETSVLTDWRESGLQALLKQVQIPVAVGGVALIVLLPFASGGGVVALAGLVLAAGVAAASVAPLWQGNPLRLTIAEWGAMLVLFGIAVALAGVASDAGFATTTDVVARQDSVHRVGPYWIRTKGVRPVLGSDWSAVAVDLAASRTQDGTGVILSPESRRFVTATTSIRAVERPVDGELSAILGDADGKGDWALHLSWRPFVTLIWYGGLIAALGGLISLLDLARVAWRREDDDEEEGYRRGRRWGG